MKKVRIKKKLKRKAPAKKQKIKPAKKIVSESEKDSGTGEAATIVVEEVPPVEKKAVKPPEPIIPAGPMLEKPKPAKLSGPQLVRIEAPEPEKVKPLPRARGKARHEERVTEPLMQNHTGAGMLVIVLLR
ncbi:MAG: hypothetical protein ACYSSL_02090 [Planctomycetota bacterium]